MLEKQKDHTAILAVPLAVRRMLGLLRSRWMICLLCILSKPLATSIAIFLPLRNPLETSRTASPIAYGHNKASERLTRPL